MLQVFSHRPILVEFFLKLIFVEKYPWARFIPGVIFLDFNSVAGRMNLAPVLIYNAGNVYSYNTSLPRVGYTRGKHA